MKETSYSESSFDCTVYSQQVHAHLVARLSLLFVVMGNSFGFETRVAYILSNANAAC